MKILDTKQLDEKLKIESVSKTKLNGLKTKIEEDKNLIGLLEKTISQIGDYVDVDGERWDEECVKGLKKGFDMLLDFYVKVKRDEE